MTRHTKRVSDGRWFLLLALTCACVPSLLPGAKNIAVLDAPRPASEVVTTLRAVHGTGCGLLGYRGRFRGAEARLKNLAAEAGADYVVITKEQKPHSANGCFNNEYVLEAQAYRAPAGSAGGETKAAVAPAVRPADMRGVATRLVAAVNSRSSMRGLPQVPHIKITTQYWTTPVLVQVATLRGLTLAPGQRAVLAGDEAGTKPFGIDNFLLFESYRGDELLRSVSVGSTGNDTLTNKDAPVRALVPSSFTFQANVVDVSPVFADSDRVVVSFLDYGGLVSSTDVYLRIVGAGYEQALSNSKVEWYDYIAYVEGLRSGAVQTAARLPAPSGPPPSSLGFERAVDGCLPGYVYAVDQSAVGFDDIYTNAAPVKSVWACEWDESIHAAGGGLSGSHLVRYQGRFRAPEAGAYELEWSSASPARVSIDGRRILEARANQLTRARAELPAGTHSLLIEYLAPDGTLPKLGFFVTPPRGQRASFSLRPGSRFYEQQTVHYAGSRPLDAQWRSYATLESGQIAVAKNIHFVTDRADLEPDSEPVLFAVANILNEQPSITRVEIQGHTDDAGSAEYNQELSERRAAAVRDWLLNAGVAPHRLVAKGYGKTQPIMMASRAGAGAANRRVAFVFMGAGGAVGSAAGAVSRDGQRALPAANGASGVRSGSGDAASLRLVGVYGFEIFKNDEIDRRLKQLLKGKYSAFQARMDASSPVERRGDYVVGSGNMAHQGDSEYAFFAFGLTHGDMHCTIVTDSKFETISTKGFAAPVELTSQYNEAEERAKALFGR